MTGIPGLVISLFAPQNINCHVKSSISPAFNGGIEIMDDIQKWFRSTGTVSHVAARSPFFISPLYHRIHLKFVGRKYKE
jgi:hypothetical protein